MARIAFADESGTSAGAKCYAIGVISVEAERVELFERHFSNLMEKHGVTGEARWTKVRKSHGLSNFILDCLDSVLRSKTSSFDVIVVNKALFRNWQGGSSAHETAFYQTYTYLLRHIAKRAGETAEVLIDERSDHYAKRHEVVETIGNNMLAQLASKGRIKSVTKVRSQEYIGIQVADVLTGAINAAHIRFLEPTVRINKCKEVTIQRLSEMLGWDDLCYDTMPSPRFNIWHFPIEYRAVPKTREIRPSGFVHYIDAADIS